MSTQTRHFTRVLGILAILLLALTPIRTAQAGDHGEFSFTGIIQSLPGTADLTGDWVVDGVTVHVGGGTRIDQRHGAAAVGATVEVEGDKLSDGSVDAMKIKVEKAEAPEEETELKGVIQTLPGTADLTGDWVVEGVTVHVTTATMIDQTNGPAAVGATVEVSGLKQSDGSIDAQKIKVEKAEPPEADEVEFTALIGTLPGTADLTGDWVVGGVTVHVTAATMIDQTNGPAAVGATVEVSGLKQSDGSVDAAKIKVEKPEGEETGFSGLIETLPGTANLTGSWVVSGLKVKVTPSTTIDDAAGQPQIGAMVDGRGLRQHDGSLVATGLSMAPAGQPMMALAILKLTPTPQAPAGAEGAVITRSFSRGSTLEREDLKVGVEHLPASETFDVVIDTFHAGAILTDGEGEGHLFLSTKAMGGAEPLPPELQPLTDRQLILVLDQAGEIILTGKFADARHPGGGKTSSQFLAKAMLLDAAGNQIGKATAKAKKDEQEVEVEAEHLTPGADIQIVIDGILAAGAPADGSGALEVALSSDPKPGQLPLPTALQPVQSLLHVELQATDGTVLAAGDFVQVAASAPTGGGRRLHRGH